MLCCALLCYYPRDILIRGWRVRGTGYVVRNVTKVELVKQGRRN